MIFFNSINWKKLIFFTIRKKLYKFFKAFLIFRFIKIKIRFYIHYYNKKKKSFFSRIVSK